MAHDVVISRAENQADLLVVRRLWQEYWSWLGLPDDFQGFRHEWEGLPGVYGQPDGALLVARSGEESAGTVALRRLNNTSGEVKRLYLRPEYRGRAVGKRLLGAVIERASAIGYDSLYADTLPSMVEALNLYQRAGFVLIAPYSETPTPGAIYLLLKPVSRGQPESGSKLY